MPKRPVKTTRLDIIRTTTNLFLEHGYSATSPKLVCQALDISTGNLTYYFPTKEHMLALMADMLCEFQWKMMEYEANEGLSSIMAICLELTAMAAICEEDEIARDFYESIYSSSMCLDLIRRNDVKRAKEVFRDYCSDWTDEQFAEAELLVSGIEFATLHTEGEPVSLETRIRGALNLILGLYNVPEEMRKAKIARVLSMDYRSISRRILKGFKEYVEQSNEEAMEALYRAKGLHYKTAEHKIVKPSKKKAAEPAAE